MKLEKLVIRNFKGIKDYTLDVGGQNITVFGRNATGKTTLYDAFLWLLFDKDSLGRKTFWLKPMNKDGVVAAAVDTDVEGTFTLMDGEQLTLRKVNSQKKDGGHTNAYQVNGGNYTQGEYNTRIAQIMDESLFRLLTNPRHFSEVVSWQERRQTLIALAGDIPDEDVFKAEPDTAVLRDTSMSIADRHRQALAVQKEEKKTLALIPARIDEVNASIAGLTEDALRSAKRNLDKTTAIIDLLRRRIAEKQGKTPMYIEEKKAELVRQEVERNRLAAQELTEKDVAEKKAAAELVIAKHEETMEQLRAKWRKLKGQLKLPTCPTCGQTVEGAASAQAIQQIEASLRDVELQAVMVETAQKQAVAAAGILPSRPVVHDLREVDAVIAKLRAELAAYAAEVAVAVEKDQNELAQREQEQKTLMALHAKADIYTTAQERVAELAATEKASAARLEKVEAWLYQYARFVQTKMRLLEDGVNSMFAMAKFRLFNHLKNGEVEDVCETVYNGVPWSNLNHGARINVGLDIINTLSAHYGVTAPVFVDNAEALTSLIPSDGQLIQLTVSDADKLTVEVN